MMIRNGPFTVGAMLVLLSSGCAGPARDERPTTSRPEPVAAAAEPSPSSGPADADQTAPAADRPYVPLMRGPAELAYVKPVTTVENSLVVTVFKIRNRSPGAIAGLKLEEFWWDKAGNPVTGSSTRMKTRLEPGEVATLTLETPKKAGMYQCNYRFSHANGPIKAVVVASLE
jgi:hypothetical protein